MEQPYESPAFSNSWQIYGDSPRLDPSTVFSLWCHHGTDSLGVSCEYNNIRVVEYPFSNEPKVLTFHTQEQLTSKHAILTCSDLSPNIVPPPPPHTHTHTSMHACMRMHPPPPPPPPPPFIWGRQETEGSIRSREKVDLELWLQGRQSFEHVTQRNGGSWWRDNERKSVLSLKFIASVWNMKYTVISRGAESARWQVQFKVRKVRRSSASDHTVADCSSLFCILLATSANPQEEG